jgi:hypothetical protein
MLEFPQKWYPGKGGAMRFDYGKGFGPSWEEYAKASQEALLKIRGTTIGEQLLAAIEKSPRKVEVLYGKQANAAGLASPGDADAACFVEVADHRRLHEKLQALFNGKLANSTGVTQARRKLEKAKIQPLKGPSGEWRIPEFELNPIERGKLAYWVMDHLTPGLGADAWVIWHHDIDDLAGEFADTEVPAWAKRPPWVALAHELIHAWRIATGRVVFHPSTNAYYEEAMTVGLPPYDHCEFTENRFREFGKEARRTYYGPTTKKKSEKAEAKHPAKTWA